MTSSADNLRRMLRRWLKPLRATPLHPQWLIHRIGKGRTDWVAQRADGAILDVGCADQAIKRELPQLRGYVGLDYPATASHLYGTRPDVFGDASGLPFKDACFDTVLMLDVLEHVARPGAALQEAARVLRPGGRLLVTIPFAYPLHDQPHDYQRFTAHGIANRLSAVGLRPVMTDEVAEGIGASMSCLVLTLAQGAIAAIAARSWRVIFVPLVLILIPLFNLASWLLSTLLPVAELMPAAYYVHAERRMVDA
ncbi:MAG TPA: class I SAM-dependent methyltransferase [Gammaproteobacteria bacterium]